MKPSLTLLLGGPLRLLPRSPLHAEGRASTMKSLLSGLFALLMLAVLPGAALADLCAPWPPPLAKESPGAGAAQREPDPGARARGDQSRAPGAGYRADSLICERPLGDAPYLKVGREAEPWLPRLVDALDRNRPQRYALGQVALLGPADGDRYLVVKWDEPDGFSPWWPMEFHKVIRGPDGRRRLKWLRGYAHERARLLAPTGHALAPGEPPVAVMFLASGGSWANGAGIDGYRLRLFQMTRNTVDISPDWAGRLIDVVDLDGDGRYEAVVDDPSWTLQVHPQDPQFDVGPLLVLARRDGRFVHACRDFAGAYDALIRGALASAEDRYRRGQLVAAALNAAFFAYLQTGAFDEARDLLGRFETAMQYVLMNFRWTNALDRFPTPEQVREDHEAVLAAALRHADAPCPASAAGVHGGPNGILHRRGEPDPFYPQSR